MPFRVVPKRRACCTSATACPVTMPFRVVPKPRILPTVLPFRPATVPFRAVPKPMGPESRCDLRRCGLVSPRKRPDFLSRRAAQLAFPRLTLSPQASIPAPAAVPPHHTTFPPQPDTMMGSSRGAAPHLHNRIRLRTATEPSRLREDADTRPRAVAAIKPLVAVRRPERRAICPRGTCSPTEGCSTG